MMTLNWYCCGIIPCIFSTVNTFQGPISPQKFSDTTAPDRGQAFKDKETDKDYAYKKGMTYTFKDSQLATYMLLTTDSYATW